MKHVIILLLSVILISSLNAQTITDKGLSSICVRSVEAPLEFLASDWTEGREVGTRGEYMSADYISSFFKLFNIKPLGDFAVKKISREEQLKGRKAESYSSYFQNFDLLTGPREAEKELHVIIKTNYSSIDKKLVNGTDYLMSDNPGTMQIEGPVVFLGYGITNKDLKCDPFSKLNLKGKIIFVISGFAGIDDTLSANYKAVSSDEKFSASKIEREKIENARKAGALAVIRYNPSKRLQPDKVSNLPMYYDNEFYEGDKKQDDFYLKEIELPNWDSKTNIPLIQISKAMAESLLGDNNKALPPMMKSGFIMSTFKALELPGITINLKIKKDQEVIRARNVLGYIEGINPKEAIVIGSHYDHVGKYNGFTFNGADDNASGTAGMMALARAFIERGDKPSRTIIFAAWTGEEQGLWGSSYFVKNIPDSLKIVLNINLDMISRNSIKDNTGHYLSMDYTKGYEQFEQIFRNVNKNNNFSLNIEYKSEKQPTGGSDYTPFAAEGIPVIALFTGLHKDYHMPNDEIEFVNIDKMVEIIKLTYLGLNEILKQ
jgi:hypothetical protein